MPGTFPCTLSGTLPCALSGTLSGADHRAAVLMWRHLSVQGQTIQGKEETRQETPRQETK